MAVRVALDLERHMVARAWVGHVVPGVRAAEGGLSAGAAVLAGKSIAAWQLGVGLQRSQGRRAELQLRTSGAGPTNVVAFDGRSGKPAQAVELLAGSSGLIRERSYMYAQRHTP